MKIYYKWNLLFLMVIGILVFYFREDILDEINSSRNINNVEKNNNLNMLLNGGGVGDGSFSSRVTYKKVIKVIDGDSIEIEGGEEIRYIGIDAPEYGERLFFEAKKRNRELVDKKKIRIEICSKEPRDKYGRILAWVYVDDKFVNGEILKAGLAVPLIIPPCGLEKLDELMEYYRQGRAKGVGLWGDE